MKVIDELELKLQIWDTSGNPKFRQMLESYYNKATVAIFVYDITNDESFKNINNWITFIQSKNHQDLICLLVGNKNDLELNRKISFDEGEKLSEQLTIEFFETSAKNGYNIQAIINYISDRLVKLIQSKANVDKTKKIINKKDK